MSKFSNLDLEISQKGTKVVALIGQMTPDEVDLIWLGDREFKEELRQKIIKIIRENYIVKN